jgi:hypothetical protein
VLQGQALHQTVESPVGAQGGFLEQVGDVVRRAAFGFYWATQASPLLIWNIPIGARLALLGPFRTHFKDFLGGYRKIRNF